MDSDLSSSNSNEEASKEENNDTNTKSKEVIPNISLAIIACITQPQTLKPRGPAKKENITIVINTWSTHNFININIEKRLNMFVYLATNIRVMVTGGKNIDGVGKCHKVKL